MKHFQLILIHNTSHLIYLLLFFIQRTKALLDIGKGLMSRTYSYLDSYENEDNNNNNNNNNKQPMYKSKDFNIIRKKIDKIYPDQPDVSDYTKVSSYIHI